MPNAGAEPAGENMLCGYIIEDSKYALELIVNFTPSSAGLQQECCNKMSVVRGKRSASMPV